MLGGKEKEGKGEGEKGGNAASAEVGK